MSADASDSGCETALASDADGVIPCICVKWASGLLLWRRLTHSKSDTATRENTVEKKWVQKFWILTQTILTQEVLPFAFILSNNQPVELLKQSACAILPDCGIDQIPSRYTASIANNDTDSIKVAVAINWLNLNELQWPLNVSALFFFLCIINE